MKLQIVILSVQLRWQAHQSKVQSQQSKQIHTLKFRQAQIQTTSNNCAELNPENEIDQKDFKGIDERTNLRSRRLARKTVLGPRPDSEREGKWESAQVFLHHRIQSEMKQIGNQRKRQNEQEEQKVIENRALNN
ncbi:Hypothetical_protein [Hexamita inflata]|uniref:Hypothetical_protein n=1 Tax=Hexamita inflata TaxID=28002 RepID=A0AA86USW6_9EUKA|nr:Hypothetical protein HINF_LOCUS58005 [Hexamita inflata]